MKRAREILCLSLEDEMTHPEVRRNVLRVAAALDEKSSLIEELRKTRDFLRDTVLEKKDTQSVQWPSESQLADEILQWQFFWMKNKDKVYEERASNIDANMRYTLAQRLLLFLASRTVSEAKQSPSSDSVECPDDYDPEPLDEETQKVLEKFVEANNANTILVPRAELEWVRLKIVHEECCMRLTPALKLALDKLDSLLKAGG